MKILYDYEIFTRQRFGGVSRYFYELIRHLCRIEEVKIDLFLGINSSGYDFNINKGVLNTKELRVSAADKMHLALEPLNGFWFNRFSAATDYDVFHKTYYSGTGLKLKRPLISTVHDMTHELMPEYFAKADNTASLKRSTVEHSEGVICVSETTKRDLVDCLGIDPSIIRVIYHGVTIRYDTAAPNIIGNPYLLYVGQRRGYKNFNVLLKAYTESEWMKKNFVLVCFGGGGPNFSEKLFIKENDLENNVLFYSGSDQTLISLYGHAAALIYTSLYEGFGFPPVEAMECGCPVLTSPAGSISEIAGDAASYFDPKKPEDLTNELKRMVEDSELRKSLVEKGKTRAASFNWNKCALGHLEFYNELSM
jgi:glycosyltransferase involved in cell wall biosynthesis